MCEKNHTVMCEKHHTVMCEQDLSACSGELN
jgi:hypothetical protein